MHKPHFLKSLSLAHLFGIGAKTTGAPVKPAARAAVKPAQASASRPSPSAPTTEDRGHARAAPVPDQDDDSEMSGESLIAAARRRERARCEAIVTGDAAARNPILAKTLAFASRMPRKEAIALLEAAPAVSAADPLNLARSARNPRVGAGGADAPSSQQGAARMHAALAAEMVKAR